MTRTSKIESRHSELWIAALLGVGVLLIILPAGLVRLGLGSMAGLTAVSGLLLLLLGIGLLWVRHDRVGRVGSLELFAREARTSRASGRALLGEVTTGRASGVTRPPSTLSELKLFGRPSRPSAINHELLAAIEWRRFQAMVELLFRQVGFRSRPHPDLPEQAGQIWLYLPRTPENPVAIVRCVLAHDEPVELEAVSELHDVMLSAGVPRGHLVTTSTFTRDAEAYASAHDIALIDAGMLLAQADKRSAEQRRALLETALSGDFWRPSCPQCGTKLWPRIPPAPQAPFWGCASGGGCNVTVPVHSDRSAVH